MNLVEARTKTIEVINRSLEAEGYPLVEDNDKHKVSIITEDGAIWHRVTMDTIWVYVSISENYKNAWAYGEYCVSATSEDEIDDYVNRLIGN